MQLQEGGGVVGIWNNLLNKEWEDICGAYYTPAGVTNKPKIHRVTAAGEAPPTVGRGGRKQGTRGDT